MSPTNLAKIIPWQAFRKTMTALPAVLVLLLGAHTSHAQWEVEYSDWLIGAMRDQGIFRSKRAGSFATRSECEEARRDAVIQSGDPSLDMHMKCVGFDEPSYQAHPSPTPSHPDETQQDALRYPSSRNQKERLEKERRVDEEKQQEAFLKQREELLRSLKRATPQSPAAQGPAVETGALQLKRNIPSRSSAPAQPPSGDRERTAKIIKELNCSAYYGLAAASAALNGDSGKETARKFGEYSAMAKDGKTVSGCPKVSIHIPEVPYAIESNPQLKIYNHIISQAELLVPKIIDTRNKSESTRSRLESAKNDIGVKQEKIRQLDKRIIIATKQEDKISFNEKKEDTEEELDELTKQALALERQADQLKKQADEQKSKVRDLQGMYDAVTENPSRAEELLKKVR
jgi:hypothetical protein